MDKTMAKQFNRALAASLFGVALCFAVAAGISARSPGGKEKFSFAAGDDDDVPSVSQGKMVYEQRCAICHYADSTAQKVGPGLKGLYAGGKFTDGKKVDDASVTIWIEKGGKNMPEYKHILKSKEIRALVAYLRTL